MRTPWSSNLPDDWKTLPIKRVGDVTLGKMLQSSPYGSDDVAMQYLRAANVQPDGVLHANDESLKKMWFTPSEAQTLDLLAGDVVVVEGGIGGYGRSAVLTEDLKDVRFQNSINRIRPGPNMDGRFINYCLLAARNAGFIAAYCHVASMPHLTTEKLEMLRIPVPDVNRQVKIADFLDLETANIDKLISSQHGLIVRLREHLSATITSSVLVEHGTVRLKYLTRSVRQGFSPQCESVAGDGVNDWCVLKAGCVNYGTFRPQENKLLPSDIEPRPDAVVYKDDVVISRANTRDLVGSAAVVDGDFPRLMLSDKTYALTLDANRVVPQFASLVLGTPRLRQLIELEATGASQSMQNISQADILNLPIPLPSVDEQKQILRRLDAELPTMKDLVGKANQLAEVLKERRAALIHGAVTGKMDHISD
jgi:type I restriction enzyme S subunit